MNSPGKIAQYQNISFYMYMICNDFFVSGNRSEHGPAHVHVKVKLTNEDVVYLRYYIGKNTEEIIEDIEIDKNRRGLSKPPLLKKHKKKALEYIRKHKLEFIDIWDKIQSGKEYKMLKEK